MRLTPKQHEVIELLLNGYAIIGGLVTTNSEPWVYFILGPHDEKSCGHEPYPEPKTISTLTIDVLLKTGLIIKTKNKTDVRITLNHEPIK